MKLESISSKFGSLALFLRSSETVMGFILALIVGVIAGFGAVLFRWMIGGFHSLAFDGGARLLGFLGPYYVILLPVIGGLIVGPIIYFFAKEAKGHGVPEVMLAVANQGGCIRPRVSVVKSIASSICIGSGGSVGREGPIVQIGSAAGSTIGQWLRLPSDWVKTLVACGAAGGISATFNAPIAGVLFALEVILGRFTGPKLGFVIVSSVLADIVAHVFLGDKQSFLIPDYKMVSTWEMPLYILLGIAVALVAVAFIFVLYKTEDLFDAWRFPEYLKPAFGGLIVGLIGLYSGDLFGVGYGGIEKALQGNLAFWILLPLVFLKMLATSFTLGSGGSGGIFAPSLFMGSMLGGTLGKLFHRLFPAITASSGAYALVGMAAFFAGAARAPFTSVIIIFEMTRDYSIILPLLMAVVVSTIVSRSLSRDTIYTAKIRRRGIDLGHSEEEAIMRSITVGKAMTRNFPTVLPDLPVSHLVDKFARTGHHGFPVVDEDGYLLGIVTLTDVEVAMSREDSELTVKDIATKSPIVAYPDQTLHEALVQLGGRDVGRIPVVERGDKARLLGMLRRHDIIRAYTRTVPKRR